MNIPGEASEMFRLPYLGVEQIHQPIFPLANLIHLCRAGALPENAKKPFLAGICLAALDLGKQYRREDRYFDEIIGGE